jgi:hypothetical protein
MLASIMESPCKGDLMRMLLFVALLITISCVKTKEPSLTSGNTTTTYKSYFACTNSGGESIGELYTFYSNGNYVLEMIFYSVINCAVSGARERNYFTGTYSYNSTSRIYSEDSKKLEVAYLTSAEVDAQNLAVNCGYSNWMINTYKNITDNFTCNGGSISAFDDPDVYNNVTMNDSVFNNGYTVYIKVN